MCIEEIKSPFVSIIIPVYNGEDYIEEAIESILRQDYSYIELIVLDDGSTDNTRKILQQYKNFYWETHPNMGQAKTLNKGWAMAKGEVLSYLSADDILMPTVVSTSLRYLENYPNAVMTYCDFNLIDPDSKVIRRVQPPDFNYIDMVVNIDCPPGPGVFFKKKAFQSAGEWNSDYRQMPDYEYWLRLGRIGQFVHISEVLAAFRIHETSQTFASGDFNKSDEPIRIIREYFRDQSKIPESILSCKSESLANAYLVSSQLHWRSGRFQESVLRIVKAVSIFPRVVLKRRIYKIVVNALFNRIGHRFLRFIKKIFRQLPTKSIGIPL